MACPRDYHEVGVKPLAGAMVSKDLTWAGRSASKVPNFSSLSCGPLCGAAHDMASPEWVIQERKSNQDRSCSVLYNLVSEVTYHHFCFLLLMPTLIQCGKGGGDHWGHSREGLRHIQQPDLLSLHSMLVAQVSVSINLTHFLSYHLGPPCNGV